VRFAVKVVRILEAPLLLARLLAGELAFWLPTEPLAARISRLRSEPTPAVTTPSHSFRAHRLPPLQNPEEYDKRRHANRLITHDHEHSGLALCHREEERR